MAAVYAATRNDGRQHALKIMHRELCGDDELRERFLREGHIARKVDHPGVVRVFDDDVTETGEPFLIMELLVGSTLSRLWRKNDKKLPVEASLIIAANVLDALSAFHDIEIVHRDLKPANIFVTTERDVKVLDFGVAQHREAGRDITRVGLAVGTPSFMAPEQALGKSADVDHRADIYAVGATLYTIVGGRKLHEGATEQESTVLAATQPAPSVARIAPDLPLAVVTLIDKSLQWDPRNRFQSADEMRDAIETFLAVGGQAPQRTRRSQPPAFEPARLELDIDEGSVPPGDITSAAGVGTPSGFYGAVRNSGSMDLVGDIELAFEPKRHSPSEHPADGVHERRRAARHHRSDSEIRSLLPQRPPATAAQSSEQGLAGPDVPLLQDDPLAPLFVRLDRLLKTARQYGPSHPETHSRIDPVFEAASMALEHVPGGLHLRVLPFCLSIGHKTVWEPSPPGDIVPYTLSVAGVREIHVMPGVEQEELRELIGAMMVDPSSNPAEIATALWEAPFKHVQCRIEEDLGGEDAQSLEDFFSEAAELERELQMSLSDVQKMALSLQREDVLEAAAVAAMTDTSDDSGALLMLDEQAQERLAAATRLSNGELRVRHDEIMLDAFADAALRRDLAALADAVMSYTRRLVRLGRDEELYATHRELIGRLYDNDRRSSALSPTFITAAMFPGDVLMHVVRTASGFSELLNEQQCAAARAGFEMITKSTGPRSLKAFLKLAQRLGEGPLFDHILSYLVRVFEGEEDRVFAYLEKLNPLLAQRIVTTLVARGGARVKALLRPLLQSTNSAIRCEAMAQLATDHEQLTRELMQLFKSDDRIVRWAALDTFIRHRVVSAGPALVAIVERESFQDRALDEQQRVLSSIQSIHPPRCEKLLCEITTKHGIIAKEPLERTRMLAARMLGVHADSAMAIDALEQAATRRPWNSPQLREVAATALRQLEARIASRDAAGRETAGRKDSP